MTNIVVDYDNKLTYIYVDGKYVIISYDDLGDVIEKLSDVYAEFVWGKDD